MSEKAKSGKKNQKDENGKTDSEEKKEDKKESTQKTEEPATQEQAKKIPAPAPKKKRVAVVNVYSSKNDTIVTATDLSGGETLAWASGGMMVKADREEGRPYAAMQAAIKVINLLKEKGIYFVHVKIRAPGGVGLKTPGPGAQAVVCTIARCGVRIGRIEDVTPLPTDSMKRKGGRRGRRV